MKNPKEIIRHGCTLSHRVRLFIAAAVCVLLVACSGGEAGPQPGSPEWNWAAAVDNVAVGDYGKADEQIEAVAKSDGELAAKATLWRAALLIGLTTGYDALVDAYVDGQNANQKQVADFQNAINAYRRQSRQSAIDFVEGIGAVKKAIDGKESVVLEFPLPDGSSSESPILSTVVAGRPPRTDGAPSESTTLESQTLTRAILLTAAELSGAGDDVEKLRSSFGSGGATVSRSDFEVSLARHLLDTSTMFDREGLNEPKVRTLMFDIAQKWAEPYLENADYKDWATDFKFDVTNEQRDMEGKRRIKKD